MKENDKKERWIIPLLVVVLAVVAGVVSWSLISRRTTPTADTATATTSTAMPATNRDTVPGETNDTPTVTVPTTTSPEQSTAPIGTAVGDTAPGFTLEDLSGNSVSLSSYRGHVVILDFWASWCAPCRASMPSLHQLADQYSDQGLVMIGVSLDRRESDASSFLKENGYTDMVALWESAAASQGVAREYGIISIPHTFVIDRNGIIRFADHPAMLRPSLLSSLF